MERPCPLWPDERECSSKECGIEHCDDEVPAALRIPYHQTTVRLVSSTVADNSSTRQGLNKTENKVVLTNSSDLHSNTDSRLSTTCSSPQSPTSSSTTCTSFKQIDNGADKTPKDPACSSGNQFDPIDTSLTEGDKKQLDVMEHFEDASDRFCDFEGLSITILLQEHLLSRK